MLFEKQFPNYVLYQLALKRLFTFILLGLFLFNAVGYYGVYLGLRIQANQQLRAKLDNNHYTEEETITVKIPFALPYQTDWQAFQRVDGDFEKDGKFYNLVKQKVERDTLVIVYIRDHHESQLFESLIDFVHSNTDTPLSKKAGKLIENFAKDYLSTYYELQSASKGWSINNRFLTYDYAVIAASASIHSPPPRATR